MVPALRHGDQLLVWFGRGARADVGDVVVVRLPDGPLSVKRVTRVGGRGVYVEGDNVFGSTDSRDLGVIDVDAVVGRVLVRLWPRPGRVARRRSEHL